MTYQVNHHVIHSLNNQPQIHSGIKKLNTRLLCFCVYHLGCKCTGYKTRANEKRNLNILISFIHSFFLLPAPVIEHANVLLVCSIKTAEGISMKICEEIINSFKVTIMLCHSKNYSQHMVLSSSIV